MTEIKVRLPRLLQTSTHTASIAYSGYAGSYTRTENVVDFSTSAILTPIKLGVKLSYDTLCKATLTMPEDAAALKIHDFVELYDHRGSIGIYRVVSSGINPRKNRTYSLNHAFDTFNDAVIGHITAGTTTDGTQSYQARVKDLLLTVMSFQTSNFNRCYWQLGEVEASVQQQMYEFNNSFTNAKSVLDAIGEKYTDCVYTFDFSTTPWTLNFVKRKTAIETELRLHRNIQNVEISRSDTDQCTRLYLSIDNQTDPFVAEANKTVIYQVYENPHGKQAEWGVISKAVGIKTEEVPDLSTWLAQYWELHEDPQLDISITAMDYSKYSGEPLDALNLGSRSRVILTDFDGDDRVYIERIMQMDNDDLLRKPLNWKLALSNKRKTAGGAIAKAREKTESAASTARTASIRSGGGGGSGSGSSNAITKIKIDGPDNNVYTLKYYQNEEWKSAETTFSRATTLIGGYHLGGGGLVDVYSVWDPETPGRFKIVADPQGDSYSMLITMLGHWGDGSTVNAATGEVESRSTYYGMIRSTEQGSTATLDVKPFQIPIHLSGLEWSSFDGSAGLPSSRIVTYGVYKSENETASNTIVTKSTELFLTQALDGSTPVVYLRPGSASASPVAKLQLQGFESGTVSGIQIGAPNVGSYRNGTIPIEFSVSAYELLEGVDEDEDGNDDLHVLYAMNPAPVFNLPLSHSLSLRENTSSAIVTGNLITTLSRSEYSTEETVGYVRASYTNTAPNIVRITSALRDTSSGTGTAYGITTTDVVLSPTGAPVTTSMRIAAEINGSKVAFQTISLSRSTSSGQPVVQAIVNGTSYAEIPVDGEVGENLITIWQDSIADVSYSSSNKAISFKHVVVANRDDDEGGYVPVGTDGTTNPHSFDVTLPWLTNVEWKYAQSVKGNAVSYFTIKVTGGINEEAMTQLAYQTVFLRQDGESILQDDGTYLFRVSTGIDNDTENYAYCDWKPYSSIRLLQTYTQEVSYQLQASMSGRKVIDKTDTLGYVKGSVSSGSAADTMLIVSALRATNEASAAAYAVDHTVVKLSASASAAGALSSETGASTGDVTVGAYVDGARYALVSLALGVSGGNVITTPTGYSDVEFTVNGTVVARKRVRANVNAGGSDPTVTLSGQWQNGTYTVTASNGQTASTTLWGASAGTPAYYAAGRINLPYYIYDRDNSGNDADSIVKTGTMTAINLSGLLETPAAVTPGAIAQTIRPSQGYIGLASVTVNAVSEGGGSSSHTYAGQRITSYGTYTGVNNGGSGILVVDGNRAYTTVRFLVDGAPVYSFSLEGTFSGSAADYATGWSDAYGKISIPRTSSTASSTTIKLPQITVGSTSQDTVTFELTQGDFGGNGVGSPYKKYVYIHNNYGANVARAVVDATSIWATGRQNGIDEAFGALGPKTITNNGIFTAGMDGLFGYSYVVVNVPTSGGGGGGGYTLVANAYTYYGAPVRYNDSTDRYEFIGGTSAPGYWYRVSSNVGAIYRKS